MAWKQVQVAWFGPIFAQSRSYRLQEAFGMHPSLQSEKQIEKNNVFSRWGRVWLDESASWGDGSAVGWPSRASYNYKY